MKLQVLYFGFPTENHTFTVNVKAMLCNLRLNLFIQHLANLLQSQPTYYLKPIQDSECSTGKEEPKVMYRNLRFL